MPTQPRLKSLLSSRPKQTDFLAFALAPPSSPLWMRRDHQPVWPGASSEQRNGQSAPPIPSCQCHSAPSAPAQQLHLLQGLLQAPGRCSATRDAKSGPGQSEACHLLRFPSFQERPPAEPPPRPSRSYQPALPAMQRLALQDALPPLQGSPRLSPEECSQEQLPPRELDWAEGSQGLELQQQSVRRTRGESPQRMDWAHAPAAEPPRDDEQRGSPLPAPR
mmetsp:Transcript_33299/g.72687  ORF Transcript_33299/g.72687 Transcript_33299/m.72687 type:complete len:220 (+) Transcript_33299:577-1236(+)